MVFKFGHVFVVAVTLTACSNNVAQTGRSGDIHGALTYQTLGNSTSVQEPPSAGEPPFASPAVELQPQLAVVKANTAITQASVLATVKDFLKRSQISDISASLQKVSDLDGGAKDAVRNQLTADSQVWTVNVDGDLQWPGPQVPLTLNSEPGPIIGKKMWFNVSADDGHILGFGISDYHQEKSK